MYTLRSLLLSVTLGLLLLSGCNVFEGFYEAGTSGDVNIMMQDADVVRQNGDAAKAAEIYEQVLEKDPENKPAKAKLSATLLERDGIGVMDLLRIARELDNTLTENDGTTSSLLGKQSSSAVCSFDGDPVASIEQFYPRELEGFDRLIDKQETLDRVHTLISEVLDTTDPQTPDETFTIESLTERVHALLDDGMAEEDVAAMLRDDAIALAALSYINVNEVARDDDGNDLITFWHVTSGSGTEYMGYCAASQDVLDATLAEVACRVDELQQATIHIRVRADELLQTDAANDVATEAERGYNKLVEELDQECATASASLAPPSI